MTLLGKIFTVLIFMMSLVFMTISLAVYATHTNWRKLVDNPSPNVAKGESLGLIQQRDQLTTMIRELEARKNKLEQQLAMEKAARRQALAALEARARQLNERVAALEERNRQLVQQEREAILAMETAQRNLNVLRDEVGGLRTEIVTVQRDRDAQFGRVVELTDRVHQAIGIRGRLEERNQQLAGQVAQYRTRMETEGIDPSAPPSGRPPQLNGIVTAVSGSGFVEISLGSDSGLKEGHELDVFNNESYLGRVVVRRTTPNRAVAEVTIKRGDIQKGNRVTTRSSS